MTRKIIKIGSSVGITLPKALLTQMGLSVGDAVVISEDKNTGCVSIEPEKKKYAPDKENVEWAKEFVERYRPALEELADK